MFARKLSKEFSKRFLWITLVFRTAPYVSYDGNTKYCTHQILRILASHDCPDCLYTIKTEAQMCAICWLLILLMSYAKQENSQT